MFFDFEPWALKEMEREGLTPEEYCNLHMYNWDDILREDDDDDDDVYDDDLYYRNAERDNY